MTSITNLPTFDAYIQQSVDVVTGFGSYMRSELGCNGWNGAKLRYHTEALCSVFASLGSDPRNNCPSAGKTVNFCSKSVEAFVTSFESVISNSTDCPSPNNARATEYSNWYKLNAKYLATNGSCNERAFTDVTCGFASAIESTTYCLSLNSTSLDSCCGGLVAPASIDVSPFIVSKALPPASPTQPATTTTVIAASTDTSGSKASPILAIGISGGVGLVLMVVTFTYICTLKKRRAHREFVTLGSDKDLTESHRNMAMQSLPASKAATGQLQPARFSRPMSSGRKLHPVIYNYYPEKEDELVAYIGDMLLIQTEFDDGWCYGGNMRTMQEGFFPKGILGLSFPTSVNMSAPPEQPQPASPVQRQQQHQQQQNRLSQQQQRYPPVQQQQSQTSLQSSLVQPQKDRPASIYSMRVSSMYGMDGGSNGAGSPSPSSALNPAFTPVTLVSPVSSAPPTSIPDVKPNVRIVQYDYIPAMNDEIELRMGDQIDLTQEYDDGWGFARNLLTGKEGVVPLDCLVGYDSAPSSPDNAKHKHRTSSILGSEHGQEEGSFKLPSQHQLEQQYGLATSSYGAGPKMPLPPQAARR
ncbi:hypothetical protein BC830DRAFT_964191 [Chytriomyces sp. MP71]|nr:hypothetical protein BC830DRAFT_964191 [Chytriomyces sp. MP71]